MISVNNNILDKGIFSIIEKKPSEEKTSDSEFFNLFSSIIFDKISDNESKEDLNNNITLGNFPFQYLNHTSIKDFNLNQENHKEYGVDINCVKDDFESLESLDSLLLKISNETKKLDQGTADEIVNSINQQFKSDKNDLNLSNPKNQIYAFNNENEQGNLNLEFSNTINTGFNLKSEIDYYDVDNKTISKSEINLKESNLAIQTINLNQEDISNIPIDNNLEGMKLELAKGDPKLSFNQLKNAFNPIPDDISNIPIDNNLEGMKSELAKGDPKLSFNQLKNAFNPIPDDVINDLFKEQLSEDISEHIEPIINVDNTKFEDSDFSENTIVKVGNNLFKDSEKLTNSIPIIDDNSDDTNIKDKSDLIKLIRNLINEKINLSNQNPLSINQKIDDTFNNSSKLTSNLNKALSDSMNLNDLKTLVQNLKKEVVNNFNSANIENIDNNSIYLHTINVDDNLQITKKIDNSELIQIIKNEINENLNIYKEIDSNLSNPTQNVSTKNTIKQVKTSSVHFDTNIQNEINEIPLEIIRSIPNKENIDLKNEKSNTKTDNTKTNISGELPKVVKLDYKNTTINSNEESFITIDNETSTKMDLTHNSFENKIDKEINNSSDNLINNYSSNLNNDNNYSQSNNNSQKKQNEQNKILENLGNINHQPNNFTNKLEPINSNQNTPNSLNYISKLEELSSKISSIASKNIDGETTTARINLSPKSLGTLVVEITQKKDDLKIVINAESKDVANLIEQNIGGLKEKLMNQGINIQNVELNINVQTQTATLMNKGENKEDKGSARQDKKQNKYSRSSEMLSDIDQSTINYKKYDSGKFIEKYI